MKYEQIWNAVDKLAKSKGLSPSGLAKLAGLDATTFNKSKRTRPDGNKRWPSMESINKILYFNRKNLLTHLLIANIVFLDENHFKSISYFCTKLNSKQQNEELESMFIGPFCRIADAGYHAIV